MIKRYFQRLKDNCPARTYAFWWVIRLSMIGLMIYAFMTEPEDSVIPAEIIMNLAVMFIWEICMAMPPKNVFRYVPPVLQTVITVADFIAVVAGYLFNFYYEVRLWDSALHFIGGFVGVYFGYEITCALFKLEKKTASFPLVLIASVGFCFMCTTFWEIFEFSCDQIVGMMSGVPNDVQHWSYEKAIGTPKMQTIFDPLVKERWPLMDTMGDIVLNTLGSILAAVLIKIYRYRHKGKYRFSFDFENENK